MHRSLLLMAFLARAAAAADQGPSIVVTPEMGAVHAGVAAPDFELTDQSGHKIRLSSLRGSVVLLAFVSSWCPFSQAEQPNLGKVFEDYKGKNVKVVAIDVKEDDAGYRRYLAREKMPFPVLHDPTGATTLSYTPEHALPDFKDRAKVLVTANLVIDRKGVVRFFTLVDTVDFDDELTHARKAIDELLAEDAK